MNKVTLFMILVFGILIETFADNPLVTHIFTADPTARVFNGTLYIYPSHDIQERDGLSGANGFMMGDYHVFSTTDLINYKDHGEILNQKDVDWVDNNSYAMWAPDCNEKNGKYYFYFPGNFRVGVAVADHPAGPFTPMQEPIKHAHNIDPNVFIDDDGTPYLYFGGGDNLNVMRLKDDMITPDMNPTTVRNLPSGYKEGSFVFKRNGTYYFTFPHSPAEGRSEEIAYATGSSPLGPFTYKGKIMDGWSDGCWTNHHSIVQYKGQWYIFYHHKDVSGDGTLRSMCADKLFFNADGSIRKVTPTLRGIGIRKAYDKIQVDRYSEKNNVEIALLKSNEPIGWKTQKTKNNGWIKYNEVDFGTTSYSKILARVASTSTGGKIELRLGSNTGKLLGTVDVPNTGGLSNWTTVSTSITSQALGIKDLVCVFKSASNNSMVLNWVQFAKRNTIVVSKKGSGNGIIQLNGSTLCDIDNMSTVLPYSASENYSFSFKSTADNEFAGWMKNGVKVSEITNVKAGDEIIALLNYNPPPRKATSILEVEDYNEQEGIEAEACSEGGQNIGFIQNGDYIKFNDIDFENGVNAISIRAASETKGGKVNIYIDSASGAPLASIDIGTTGGFQTWKTTTKNIQKITGIHDLYLKFVGGAGYLFNLNWVRFKASGDNNNNNNNNGCASTNQKIEAEAYTKMSGIQAENCTEGGKNIGYIDDGDWMEYCVKIPEDDNYKLSLRVAALNGGGKAEIQLNGQSVATEDIPQTNDWQTWQTIETTACKSGTGNKNLRIKALKGGFNINWLSIKAELAPTTYVLTVKTGNGGGDYAIGATVDIEANAAHNGKVFDKWTGDISTIANINSANTTLTMPAKAAIVTATYKDGSSSTKVSLAPIQDTYLQGSARHNNELLRIENRRRIGYLMYDLSSVSGTITSAKLELTCISDPGNGDIKVNLGSTSSWTENNISHNNKPLTSALLGRLNKNYNVGTTYTWHLDAASIPTNDKLSLVISSTGGNDVAFATKENAGGAPKLILSYDDTNSRKSTSIIDAAFKDGKEMLVFPNPVRDRLTIQLNTKPAKDAKVEVYNSVGVLVLSTALNEAGNVNVRTLSHGMYILHVISADKVYVEQFVKE